MQLRLAFVDSIAASPTLRLDLHQRPWNVYEQSRFDPPPLRRSVAETLLADGGTPTASVYGNRSIELHLQLLDVTEDEAADQLALLLRELDRPTNVLRYQPGTAAPVFFRTFRAGPDQLDFDPVSKDVTVNLLAEPFAYGLEETIAPVSVANNPAAASNGLYFDITGVKGDVETPLHLVLPSGMVSTGRRRSGLAVRRRGNPANVPLVLQAESMTQGTDTTVQPNSATMSGSGSNYSRTTFATQTGLTQRLSTATIFPTSGSVDARGTYRVFARVRQNTASDSIIVRLRWGGEDAQVSNANVTLPANTTVHYVDLGLIQIPQGYDPQTRGLSGVELATEGVFLAVDARRVSGSGTLDVDVLLLWPADDRQEYVLWPELANVWDFVLEGGPSPAAYARNAVGQIMSTQAIEIAGGGMMISPGVTNRIFFARDLGTSASSVDSISFNATISGSYWPRYLRPAAS